MRAVCFLPLLLMLAACGKQPVRFPEPTEAMLHRLDRDGSGTLTAEELHVDNAARILSRADQDGDGQLSVEELKEQLSQFEIPTQATSPGGPRQTH